MEKIYSYISQSHHHALLFEGDFTELFGSENTFIKNFNKTVLIKPEYIYSQSFENLKIDKVRELKSLMQEKTSGLKIFFIQFHKIGREAQNALLKIVEEPSSNTKIIFFCPHKKEILPTLLSRVESYYISINYSEAEQKAILGFTAKDYLVMNISEKFNLNKKITDQKSKKYLEKNKFDILFSSLEILVKEKKHSRAVYESRAFSKKISASMKMILDNLAIQLSD